MPFNTSLKKVEHVNPQLYPDDATLALLQAILLTDVSKSSEAFKRWQAAVIFDDMSHAHMALMGELASVIDQVSPGYEHRTRLMGLKKYVWSNNIRILHPALEIIDASSKQGIDVVLIKGGAVIASDASHLYRRFIRDLDLLVPESQMVAFTEILLGLGWRPTTGRIPGSIRAQSFDKLITDLQGASYRVEIDVHRSVLHLGRNGYADEVFFERTREAQLLARPVRILSLEDWALVSLMHGGVYSVSPNFAWLIDAVRAIRSPRFSAPHFLEVLHKRSLLIAAQPIINYLREHFDLPLPGVSANNGLFTSYIFTKEADAIACSRQMRGVSGRFFLWLAEVWRSKSWGRSVNYVSDRGVYARRSWFSIGSAPARSRIEYRLFERDGQKFLEVKLILSSLTPSRGDIDIWCGHQWLSRVRFRSHNPLVGHGGGLWRVMIPVPIDINLTDVRCDELASGIKLEK